MLLKFIKNIFQKTCFEHGEKIIFCFFNEGIQNLQDGYIECRFPDSVFITENKEPERSVMNKPVYTLIPVQTIQNMGVLFPLSSIREHKTNTYGPYIRDQQNIYMVFTKIVHHQNRRFPEYILIAAFESGTFSIEWKLHLEGLPEPIVGVFNLIVED